MRSLDSPFENLSAAGGGRAGGKRWMAYLPGYRHDVFVSYAWAPRLARWAQKLRDELSEDLNYKLGAKDPSDGISIWMDLELLGNKPLTPQIQEAVENSAILLIVMSRFYLESVWCGEEVGWFEAIARRRSASTSRIFVVRAESTEAHDWPNALKDKAGEPLRGYRFHQDVQGRRHADPLGFPLPLAEVPGHAEFWMALQQLAGEMALQIDELGTEPVIGPSKGEAQTFLAAAAAEPGGTPRKQIFLHKVGGDRAESSGEAAESYLRSLLGEFHVEALPDVARSNGRDPRSMNDRLRELTRQKSSSDAIVVIHEAAADDQQWLLEYVSEIVPAARRDRGRPPALAIVDATSGGTALALGPEIPVFRYEQPGFRDSVVRWLSAVET
jgi:hypothetical protein